jgi:hypothetical protein
MTIRKLEGNDAIDFIINVLEQAGKPLTTREVQEETKKKRVRCPDSTVVYLNKLRIKGLINGKRSAEKKAWIWWIDI